MWAAEQHGKVSKESVLFCAAAEIQGIRMCGGRARPLTIAEALVEKTGKTVEVLKAEAREELGINIEDYHNFAIVGPTGVGKSSYINAIVGALVATVGEFEATKRPQYYLVPRTPVALWDFPGYNTPRQPVADYFIRNKLYAFDAVLFMDAGHAQGGLRAVVDHCASFGVPYAIVRNKADDLIGGYRGTRDERIAAVRAKLDADLAGEGIGRGPGAARRFLVSARQLQGGVNDLDENELMDFVRAFVRG